MKKPITKYLLFGLLILISCKTKKSPSTLQSNTENYQALIDSIYLAHPKSVGIMAHIEAPEKGLSWSGCAGYANFKDKTALTPDQPALIASSIKTYVAATILRLEELGDLSIEDPVSKYISDSTRELFQADGYDFDKIKLKHLLSHTSGIKDYANEDYLDWIDKHQKHRWTRDEQLRLAVKVGDTLGPPGTVFSYADANFLLCTEIIEQVSELPFYTAMRKLLRYEELGYVSTWFPTLETPSTGTKPLVHQYWGSKNWDSYEHDISWDLYGGGGIATTTRELAKFSHDLFNGKIIQNVEVFNKIYTKIIPADEKDGGYRLGLREVSMDGYRSYGHGGFWGTVVLYFPELNASIAIYVLDKDMTPLRDKLVIVLLQELAGAM